jgi:hypothetical protein
VTYLIPLGKSDKLKNSVSSFWFSKGKNMNCQTSYFRIWVFSAFALALLFCNSPARAQNDHAKKLDEFLSQGKLADSAGHFSKTCSAAPTDHQARLALGLTQVLQAIEGLGQANFRYGLISRHAQQIPLARLPVPLNENPEQLSYEKLRQVIVNLESELKQAEATLAEVNTSDVKLDFYIGRAQLDLNGDEVLEKDETLWEIFSAINTGVDAEQGNNFLVGVDGADVHWLRGYCHVLMAICDVILAHDERELFERCGQLLFLDVDSPYSTSKDGGNDFDLPQIFDAIAAVHLINFKMIDRQRMKSAHAHLLAMIKQSRLSWELALAEKDDYHEWIPNPDQEGVMQVRVPREMITGWTSVLDELEAILEGKKLIPYWRKYSRNLFGQAQIPDNGTGLNLHKFFHEPRNFDLVLTIQGTNAEPFLEEGSLSTPEAWDQLTRIFRGQFFGFAIWFN